MSWDRPFLPQAAGAISEPSPVAIDRPGALSMMASTSRLVRSNSPGVPQTRSLQVLNCSGIGEASFCASPRLSLFFSVSANAAATPPSRLITACALLYSGC